MAAATVSLPQQVPHIPISHVARVRPPRILKGTASPNSVPQPSGPAPKGKVWAQGQWRDPSSNSAKASRQYQSRLVEKALRHDTHGQNIYAYANIRTNQVVYSLTRVMSNNKILPQLIYHGKKTVPAALRRDNWTPYFSLHFPPNEYGASSGLLAYHQLRELSKQRQLAAPDDMVITIQQDIDRIKARYDPVELDRAIKSKALALPKVGQLLPKKLRAKKLMNQKTTAVADVAFVLGLQAEGPDPDEAARLKEERRKEWWNSISKGAKTRVRRRARLQEEKQAQLEARKRLALKNDGSVGLNADTVTRIAMEYRGAVTVGGEPVNLPKRAVKSEEEGGVAEASARGFQDHDGVEQVSGSPRGRLSSSAAIDTKAGRQRQPDQVPPAGSAAAETREAAKESGEERGVQRSTAARDSTQELRDPKEVRILWADLRDAAYAQEWPETVVHAELERMAIAKTKLTIPTAGKDVLVTSSRSIHVIGGQKGRGWYQDPNELEALRKARKDEASPGTASAAEGGDAAYEVAARGSAGAADEARRREEAAESLREKGIEVERSRRGLWAWVKRLIGR